MELLSQLYVNGGWLGFVGFLQVHCGNSEALERELE
jgi:hypothetical protein